MKWNWGTGIVVGMIGFIGFILYFVITMMTDSRYQHELVTENYYAKEMVYQEEIDKERNLATLSGPITGKRVAHGWLLSFPEELTTHSYEGKVFLYRPSNQQLDSELPLVLSGSDLLMPDNMLVGGRWNITIEWTMGGEAYLYKESIMY